ncbi:uncharacterized protein LOC141596379 [Silene latifolia]|uniref:uncharacterized protein LOC141596379 n=1 Tax=Silene latifolia TaxID=37657 RepID=UPI003D76B8CF
MNNRGKGTAAPMQTKKRSYISWTMQMDKIMIDILHNQMKEGNKADGERKPRAYQAVADEIRTQLGISITVEHVRNRIKSWKKHYAVISYIRAFTNFKWDEDMKMIVVTTDDLAQWTKFIVDHPNAAGYRNKPIEHWDDICTFCGPDQSVDDQAVNNQLVDDQVVDNLAVVNGVEMHDEVAEAMDEELQSDGGSSTKAISSSGSKKQKRDHLADAIINFAGCFNDYLQSKTKEVLKPSPKEVYEVVKNIKGIGRREILKATKKLMDGPVNYFEMLQILPEDEKLEWILVCLYG